MYLQAIKWIKQGNDKIQKLLKDIHRYLESQNFVRSEVQTDNLSLISVLVNQPLLVCLLWSEITKNYHKPNHHAYQPTSYKRIKDTNTAK